MPEKLPPNHRIIKALAAVDSQRAAAAGKAGKHLLELTDAVRLRVLMRLYEGYRIEPSEPDDPSSAARDMIIAVTRDKVLPLFMELVESLTCDTVQPMIMRSTDRCSWNSFYRDSMDKNILMSVLQQYEDSILHNGHCALVVNSEDGQEVVGMLQSRMLVITADDHRIPSFESIAQKFGIQQNQSLDLVMDHNPRYLSTPERERSIDELSDELSLEPATEEDVDWDDTQSTEEETEW